MYVYSCMYTYIFSGDAPPVAGPSGAVDPAYEKFFKMEKLGMPRDVKKYTYLPKIYPFANLPIIISFKAVKQKMMLEGFDPNVLDGAAPSGMNKKYLYF